MKHDTFALVLVRVLAACSVWAVLSGVPDRTEGATPPYTVDPATAYALEPREKVFEDQPHVWSVVPETARGGTAWRLGLDGDGVVTVTTAQPGRLLAALWRWDYGFLQHAPQGAALNGWVRSEDSTATIADAPAPFDTLPVYRLEVAAGEHALGVVEPFGQWVLIGFEPDDKVTSTAVPPTVELLGAKTPQHVYEQGAELAVKASQPVRSLVLYQRGKVVVRSESDALRLPAKPGRYCLSVAFEGATRLESLVIGYGPIKEPGWPKGFFPVSFYGVRGGPFSPNSARHYVLDVLAQFELGANVFSVTRRPKENAPKEIDALFTALGVRRIIRLPQCRWPMRETESKGMTDDRTVYYVLFEIGHWGQSKRSDVLGLYIEDETPPEYAFRLEAVEKAFRARIDEWPGRHLLYCLGGAGDWRDAVVWRIAGSTVQMARAYPIRQSHRDDMGARARQIRAELGDMICNFQKRKTDPSTPFWIVLQSFGTDVRPPIWDPPTAAQMRMMVHMALARGVRGLTWFGYGSTPGGGEDLYGVSHWPYVPTDERYAEVARLNAYVHELRPLVTAWHWVGTVGQKTEQFDVHQLRHDDGREFVYVTNLSFAESRAGSIDLPGKGGAMEVALGPGEGRIVELAALP